jgi:hypothetical protein
VLLRFALTFGLRPGSGQHPLLGQVKGQRTANALGFSDTVPFLQCLQASIEVGRNEKPYSAHIGIIVCLYAPVVKSFQVSAHRSKGKAALTMSVEPYAQDVR